MRGLLSANLVIWSFPLYYYSVPGLLKNLIDRQLPMSLPFMCESRDGNGSGGHPSRYDRSMVKHCAHFDLRLLFGRGELRQCDADV